MSEGLMSMPMHCIVDVGVEASRDRIAWLEGRRDQMVLSIGPESFQEIMDDAQRQLADAIAAEQGATDPESATAP